MIRLFIVRWHGKTDYQKYRQVATGTGRGHKGRQKGRLEAAMLARVVLGWLEGQARGNRDRQGATRAG